MRTAFSIMLTLVILAGCSKDSGEKGPMAGQDVPGTAPQGEQGAAPGQVLPRITHAVIAPVDATSSQTLVVQYTAETTEGQPITCTYRWYVDGAYVPGETRNTLDPQYTRKGAMIEAEVIPTDGQREGRAYRTKAVTIRNTPPAVSVIELSPVPAFTGGQISAVPRGEDRDGDSVSFLYQWEVDGKNVPDANAQSLDASGIKKKSRISVSVIPFDGEDRGEPVRSQYLTLSNKVPEITSEPPTGSEPGKYSYQVAVRDADGDALTYSLARAPQGMTINASSGLITWEPKPVTAREEVVVKIAVSDGDGGTAYQEYSLILEPRYSSR